MARRRSGWLRSRRNRSSPPRCQAAKRLLTRLLRKQGYRPKRLITDKLRSYGAAKRTVMPDVEHRCHKGLNNRAENFHVPIRKRERMIQSFRSWAGFQRFVPIFSAVRNLFVPPRSHRSASGIRLHRLAAMADWKSVATVTAWRRSDRVSAAPWLENIDLRTLRN